MKTRLVFSTWLISAGLAFAAGDRDEGKAYECRVPDFRTTSPEQLDEAVRTIVQAREAVADDLVRQLRADPPLDKRAKAQVIYLLGQWRVRRAVDVLIEHIDFCMELRELGSSTTNLPMAGPYPARDALRLLGTFGAFRIARIIGTSKFDKRHVDGYVSVLLAAAGAGFATEALEHQLDKMQDDTARKQYEMVLERVQRRIADREGVRVPRVRVP